MSKRKSPALVTFSNGERLLGEEAAGINVRYPERVYSRARDMVGKPVESVKQMLAASYLPYDVVPDERGLVNIRMHDKQSIFTTEELLTMVLGYRHKLAETHAKSIVTDAVITVPPYFGQVERKGVLDATQIAGITVLALASEHSGAALEYGIDKDFSNKTRNVIFYDMGATSLYAALVQFSSDEIWHIPIPLNLQHDSDGWKSAFATFTPFRWRDGLVHDGKLHEKRVELSGSVNLVTCVGSQLLRSRHVSESR